MENMPVVHSSFRGGTRRQKAEPTTPSTVARRTSTDPLVLLLCLFGIAATFTLFAFCISFAHAASPRAQPGRSGLGLPSLARIARYGLAPTPSSPFWSPTRPPFAAGYVPVRGYLRSSGTWATWHWRTPPDGISWNNFSFYGNVNPFTGKRGTKLLYGR